MKVRLKGSSRTSWHLDGQFIQANCIIELTSKQFKEAEKSNLIEEYIDEKPAEELPAKKYTEKELLDMKKAEQVKILEKLGIKPAKTEKERVKQILEAQNDK